MDLPLALAAATRAAVRVARTQGNTACAALVGSWATGRAGPSSDVDVILLVEHPERLLTSGDWYGVFGDGALLVRQADFGALQERRLRRCDGLVVEVNIGSLSWATTGPVESGTRRVVEDGLVPLLDPVGRLHDLVRAVLGGRCG